MCKLIFSRVGLLSVYVEASPPNCRPLIHLTGGDHKIAIFAKRDIEVGEEICFDYRYNEDHAQVHFEKKKIAIV